ncbi:MAG: alcohol dehydrogenase catalytic domain-containing protein [Fimbriimonadaceae bacterium]|nr:alcohol dehydrogenase catalytic domain-containing protein [Fimbriimonadaceae bacterium]
MKSLQILAPGRAELVDRPLPEPGPGQVRVAVICCNTCPQWDLHLDAGEPMFVGARLDYPYTPGQPGHEMAGRVDALGAGVSSFEVGQLVAAWRDQGHQREGCYADYVICEADNLLAVPAGTDPLRVASLELAMCVSVCLLDLAPCQAVPGQRAAVNGLGPAGWIAAQLLRAEGATRVVGIEPHAGRRAAALAAGVVDAAYDPTDAATDAVLGGRRSATSGIDVAVDCCGYPAAVSWLLDRTNRHVALFAVQRHDYTYAQHHAGLTLHGYSGHRKEAAEYALARILDGSLDLRPLVSVELPLSRYAEGVALLRRQEAIKICYRP